MAKERFERRTLTVLFADMVGFTTTSDGADPEDIHARVRPFHALVRQEVERTGGTVARLIGDAVMAVWGYPIAREDDAVRAARTALAIVEGMPGIGTEDGAVHVRVGVNTGEALVAFDSTDEDADDAMGDAVNVAARFQSAAPVDGIVIGRQTRRLLGERARATRLEPLTLKGKATPEEAWLLDGLGDVDGAASATTAFVGREADVAMILAAWSSTRERGSAQRVLIVGEPGIGKSRLTHEVRQRLGRDPVWHTARLPADPTPSGWAIGELIRDAAGVSVDQDPGQIHERIDAFVPPGTPDRPWLLRQLAALIGATTETPVEASDPETTWIRVLPLLARTGPTVIAIEDLHWADPATVAFLLGAAAGTVEAPLLILMTSRVEGVVAAETSDSIRRIDLGPLSPIEAVQVARSLDPTGSLDDRAVDTLVERAGGNPLFTSELARYLADGADGAVPLPGSVEAVIAARLDRLERSAQEVVGDAAVVGARFWPGALAERTDRDPSSVALALAGLERSAFIVGSSDSAIAGEPEYAFTHALLREVAYGRLTRPIRRERHLATADWMARVVDPGRGDLAAVIADHYEQALALSAPDGTGNDDRAVVEAATATFQLAAARHEETFDHRSAERRHGRAIDLLAPDDPRRVDALIGRGLARIDRARLEEGQHDLDEAVATADRLGDGLRAGSARIARSRARWQRLDPSWTDDIHDATAILERLPPSETLIHAYSNEAMIESNIGTAGASIAWCDRAIDLALALGVSAPPKTLGIRGYARAHLGDPAGLADMDAAIESALARGEPIVGAQIASMYAGAQHYFLQLDGVESAAVRTIRLADRFDLTTERFEASGELLSTARLQGRWDAAVEARAELDSRIADAADLPQAAYPDEAVFWIHHARGDVARRDASMSIFSARITPESDWDPVFGAPMRLVVASAIGDHDGVARAFDGMLLQPYGELLPQAAYHYPTLVRCLLDSGHRDRAGRLIDTIAPLTPLGTAVQQTTRGRSALYDGDWLAAIDDLTSGVEAWRRSGCTIEAAMTSLDLARALEAVGKTDEARSYHGPALATLEGVGAVATLAAATRHSIDAVRG